MATDSNNNSTPSTSTTKSSSTEDKKKDPTYKDKILHDISVLQEYADKGIQEAIKDGYGTQAELDASNKFFNDLTSAVQSKSAQQIGGDVAGLKSQIRSFVEQAAKYEAAIGTALVNAAQQPDPDEIVDFVVIYED